MYTHIYIYTWFFRVANTYIYIFIYIYIYKPPLLNWAYVRIQAQSAKHKAFKIPCATSRLAHGISVLISFVFCAFSYAPLIQLKCGGPPANSPVYSALFLEPFEMLFWSPLVPTLGLNAAKSTPKTAQFWGPIVTFPNYCELHSRVHGNTMFTVLRGHQIPSFWTLF